MHTDTHKHTLINCSIDEELVKGRPLLRLMRPAAPKQLYAQTDRSKEQDRYLSASP